MYYHIPLSNGHVYESEIKFNKKLNVSDSCFRLSISIKVSRCYRTSVAINLIQHDSTHLMQVSKISVNNGMIH
jgi:hypothetical protein